MNTNHIHFTRRRIKIIGIILIALFAIPAISSSQEPNPVKWTFSTKKLTSTTYELLLIAKIDPGWRIYSQFGGVGYLPTSIKFNTHPQVTLKDKPKEAGKAVKSTDKRFDVGLTYFIELVNFKQLVYLKTKTATTVTGSVRYTAVDSKTMLAPKTVDFSFTIGNK